MRKVGFVLLTLVSSRGAAQALTFEDALMRATQAPALVARRAAIERRAPFDSLAGSDLGPVRIALMPGVRAFAEADRGFEGQLQIGTGWSLAGLGSARLEAGSAERREASERLRMDTLAQQLAAAGAWFRLLRAETDLAASRELGELLESLRALTERRVAAGEGTAVDPLEVDGLRAELQLHQVDLSGELVAAQVELAAATGTPTIETLRTRGGLPYPELPEALEARLLACPRMPEVEALEAGVRRVRARLREAEAEAGPRLDLDALAYRESPEGLLLFAQVTLQFSVVPLAARQRAQAEADTTELEGAIEAGRLAWVHLAHEVAHEVEHAAERERVIRDEMLPIHRAIAEHRRRRLDVGEGTVLALVDATRRWTASRHALAAAEVGAAWARVRAWVLLAFAGSEES